MNSNNLHKIQGMVVKFLITNFIPRKGTKLQTHDCPKDADDRPANEHPAGNVSDNFSSSTQ
jgi:hypothetical protein